jgi:pimeloyl-ACP methyl ester carboxylesterase
VSGAFSECLGEDALPFTGATEALVAAGYRIGTIVVGGRSGTAHNAGQIAERLGNPPAGEEGPVILVGYSTGAVDILEFLLRYPEMATRVQSVVSVAGAIGGSPLAAQAGGAYDLLLGWVPSSHCPPGDGGVLDSLREQTRHDWLASNVLPGHIRYFSVAAFTTRPRMASALVPAWESLLSYDLRNDGQLLARDALIPGSTLLGYVDADHWSIAIRIEASHPMLAGRQDPRPFPRAALLEAILLRLAETATPPGSTSPGTN